MLANEVCVTLNTTDLPFQSISILKGGKGNKIIPATIGGGEGRQQIKQALLIIITVITAI